MKRRRGRSKTGPGFSLRPRIPRLPSLGGLRRPRRSALLVALAVPIAVTGVWLGRVGVEWLAARETLAVTGVRFVGLEQAAEEELRDLVALEGEPWLTLDTRDARFRLESHPWVRRARVVRPWPGRVVIRIRECHPVAVVRVGGRPYGLCEDLRIVPGTGDREDLPVIRDHDSGLGADPVALERALEYVRVFRERGLDGGLHLELRRDTGDVIALPQRGFSARVAGPVAATRAANRVASFLETLDAQGGGRGTLQLISETTAVWKASA